MKNKLYTFGCSVTENLDNLPESAPRIQYANKYIGHRYKSWPEILGNKLGMETHNYAASSAWGKFDFNLGNSNEDVLEALSIKCKDFQSNDIVLVQLTQLARFRYSNQNNKFRVGPTNFVTILPGHVDEFTEQTTLIDMLVNKSDKLWIRPLINSLNPFIRLAHEVGFTFKFWSNDDYIQEYISNNSHNNWLFDENINNLLPKLNAHPITIETNYDIDDYHLAQPGQEILADLIFHKLK